MPEVRRLIQNPADTSQGYFVWSHGLLQPFGGALPVDFDTRWSSDPVVDAWIIDWVTPSGGLFTNDGGTHTFGGAAGYQLPVSPTLPLWYRISMNPDDSGEGHMIGITGTYQKIGVGHPDLSPLPPTFSYAAVADFRYDWDEDKWIMLLRNGGMHSSMGITGYTGVTKPGRDVYRALAVSDWTATYPPFWVVDYAGSIYKGNGAEDANTGAMFPGRDVVRDLAIVSDGTGGDPLTLRLQIWSGHFREVTISANPEVTVTEPSATITDTTRPDIEWEYSDDDGDAQAAYDVRIFDEATYTAGGFDPGDDTYVERLYVTDATARTTFTTAPTVDLPNGLYRAYVRARDTAGDLSDWDYIGWEQDVTIPDAPTLDATEDSDPPVIVLDVTDSDDSGVVEVEYSDDIGTTWATVRGSGVAPTSGALTLVDHEAPLNATRMYRARTRIGDIGSAWSATATATILESAAWYLSDPTSADDPTEIKVVPPFRWTHPLPATAQRPPTRTNAIVVRAARQSIETDITLRVDTYGERAALLDLLDGTRTLLLRTTHQGHHYVEIVSGIDVDMLEVAPTEGEDTEWADVHEVKVSLVEVDRPEP